MDEIDPAAKDPRVERRRGQALFRRSRVPIKLLVPSFFTLLGLCAGLTSIRMGIDGHYDIAIGAIVFAALADGIDGRVARLLKASSRFGAELDSLADFVNFGVAPGFLIYNWGLVGAKSLGWIAVMIFALSSALRLARFNVALTDEPPRWQRNYFMGVPTPAAALVVLLPIYLDQLGIADMRAPGLQPVLAFYILAVAVLMVSTLPTYSGKLLGDFVPREAVLPLLVLATSLVALLVTYPYGTLTGASILYIAVLPVSLARFRAHMAKETMNADKPGGAPGPDTRVVDLRHGPKRP